MFKTIFMVLGKKKLQYIFQFSVSWYNICHAMKKICLYLDTMFREVWYGLIESFPNFIFEYKKIKKKY